MAISDLDTLTEDAIRGLKPLNSLLDKSNEIVDKMNEVVDALDGTSGEALSTGALTVDGDVDLGSTTGDVSIATGGGNVGFYGTTPVAQQTGVAVSAAAIHAALVALGLITA